MSSIPMINKMRLPPLPRLPSAFNVDAPTNHSTEAFDNDLLRHPFEIRLDIFKYIFVSPTGYVFHDTQNRFGIVDRDHAASLILAVDAEGQKSEEQLDLSLLQVSTAVRRECLDVLYKYNTFYVPLPSDDNVANQYKYKFAYWLSSGNIQRLALDVFPQEENSLSKNTRLIRGTINAIAKSPAMRALKSISLIMNEEMIFKPSDPEDCQIIPGYLSYYARKMSSIKSRKLLLFTPSQKSAIDQISRAIRKYDASHLKALHTAFGGQLWMNGIPFDEYGQTLQRLPFPWNCCQFNSGSSRRVIMACRKRTKILGKLLNEIPEPPSQTESDLTLYDFNPALADVNASLKQLDAFLRTPGLTQNQMEGKINEWIKAYNSKSAEMLKIMRPHDFVSQDDRSRIMSKQDLRKGR